MGGLITPPPPPMSQHSYPSTYWFRPTSIQIQLPSSSVVEQATLLRDTRVAAVPSLNPELEMNTRPASCGFSNFFRVCLGGGRGRGGQETRR